MRRLDGLIVTSLPPTNPVAALIIRAVRRVPLHYWALDINPDQAVAMGVVRATSPAARGLELINRKVLQRASSVITLDEAMAARLRRKADLDGRLHVIPPWSLRQHEEPIPHEQNPFRERLDLRGSRVVCYSGNHTPHSPLETILQAAVRLRDDPSLTFVFIGEGAEKRRIEDLVSAHALKNTRSLPYLPLDETPCSLSAADVHIVVVGEREVGLRHPCKFYSALALGRPVLLVGPPESPFVEILRREGVGWHVRHGEVDAAVGELTRAVSRRCFPRNALLERFCQTIEDATAVSPSARSTAIDILASGAAAEGSSSPAPGPCASKHEASPRSPT
jgi:hypothetical protein